MLRQIVIGAIILLSGFGVSKFLISNRETPQEKPRENVVPLVQVAPLVMRSGHLTVNGTGTIRAREELTLSAEVAGKLIYVNPKLREGQHISAGATLLRIDPTDYLSAVETAKAAIESRNVEVVQATEEMALAKAELSLFDRRSLEAPSELGFNDGASAILPPDSLAALSLHSGSPNIVAQSQSTATTQHSALATGEPQLLAAKANLKSAELQLSNAEIALKRATVKAPFSGVVRNEQVALGSYVTPGQSLGSIIGTDVFEAVIPLSESEAALIPGLWHSKREPIQARISLNYGGVAYQWPAFIDSTSNVLNPQTRTIDLFLTVKNPLKGGTAVHPVEGQNNSGPPLFVGSFVEAHIEGRSLERYAELPLEALRAGNKIWLVEDEKLRSAEVEVYQRQDKQILISTAGLGTYPMVVLNPLKTATEGQTVRVIMADETP